MKKGYIIGIVAAAVVCAGGTAALGTYAAGQIAKSNSITEDSALNFAYVDAGVIPEDVLFTHVKFDFEDGVFVYDIEFTTKTAEYDYTVNASNGRILEKDVEQIQGAAAQTPSQNTITEQQSGTNTAAVNTETEKPTVAASASENKESSEKGSAKKNSSKKSSSKKNSSKKSENAASGSAQLIGIEKAKEIALSDAAKAVGDVVFSKATQDTENGKTVYDIEFYVNGVSEHEYEIDAATGQILERNEEPWEADDTYEMQNQANAGAPAASHNEVIQETAVPQTEAEPAAVYEEPPQDNTYIPEDYSAPVYTPETRASSQNAGSSGSNIYRDDDDLDDNDSDDYYDYEDHNDYDDYNDYDDHNDYDDYYDNDSDYDDSDDYDDYDDDQYDDRDDGDDDDDDDDD